MHIDEYIKNFKILKKDFGEIGNVYISNDMRQCFFYEYKPNFDNFVKRHTARLIQISFPDVHLIDVKYIDTDSGQFNFFYGKDSYTDHDRKEDHATLTRVLDEINLIARNEKIKLEIELVEFVRGKYAE